MVFYRSRWRTPEGVKRNRDQSRRWRTDNPEKVKKAYAKWANEYPEKVREYQRKWAKENPEKVRKKTRNYVISGRHSEWKKLARENATKDGKCIRCLSRPVVSGLTNCETCRTKKSECARLTNHFGMSVMIIRELGLDKNLPAPRRKNADR